MTSYNTSNILQDYVNKIIVIHAIDNVEAKWKKNREQYLYNGSITNQNLREILHEEIIIEFDSKNNDILLKDIQTETNYYINKIKETLEKRKWFFRITNHNGKSSHIRFIIKGLEYYDKKYSKLYKQQIVEEILKEIEFKSDNITLDNSLITSTHKIVSIEKQPHFKSKYDGAIEQIIYENFEGLIPEIEREIMDEIIQKSNYSNKLDRGIIEEEITIDNVDIETLKKIWKEYYTPSRRNALIMALGGMCVRKSISQQEAENLLITLLQHVNETQWQEQQLTEFKYTYEEDKTIAVWYYIRERCGLQLEDAQELYNDFRECFGDEKKNNIQLPGQWRLMSEFASDLAQEIKDKNEIFYKQIEQEIVKIEDNEFKQIGPSEFITYIEKYVVPGCQDSKKNCFVRKSIGKEVANTTLQSEHFKKEMPIIKRIFTVPIPIIHNNELTFPKNGYDERFESWLNNDSPTINDMITITEAKENINYLFREFCFKSEQDKTNAIAALITPFIKGLLPRMTCRTPIFLYQGNRPRCGKDYCAGITGILYDGINIEDSAISTDENKKSNHTEELKKKLMGSLRQGKKRIHFSNNRGHMNNTTLEMFATSEYYSDRLLGKNEIIQFPNEIDISMSANIGFTYSEDFDKRSIKINLFFDLEDANARTFENSDLHGYVLKNRNLILSSIYVLVKDWVDKGMKSGSLPFSSFPEWARICGGVMENVEFGNPCIVNNNDEWINSGDSETNDYKMLFELCYDDFKCQKFLKSHFRRKAELYQQSHDIFPFLDLTEKKGQTIFGLNFEKYVGRILSDIKLIKVTDKAKAKTCEYCLLKKGDVVVSHLYSFDNIDLGEK